MNGCAAKNPEWLVQPTGAFCAAALDAQCLKGFAESSYSDATARVAAQRAFAKQNSEATTPTTAQNEEQGEVQGHKAGQSLELKPESIDSSSAATAKEAPPNTSEVQPPGPQAASETEGYDGSIPILAYGVGAIGAHATDAEGFARDQAITRSYDAGALLHDDGPVTSDRIQAAFSIEDKALRSDVLSGIVSLHSKSMSDEQINTVLNDLYDMDRVQYENALIVKLPRLLRSGDLERASALRSALLESSPGDRAFSMLAYVASCYSMAGLKDDAGAILMDAYREGSQLSSDDRKLVAMAIRVGDGDYPALQDFYDYQSDEVRLQAYLTISVISRQMDRPEIARRAVGDAVRFIQKASVKVDRQKSLGLILSVSPGLL